MYLLVARAFLLRLAPSFVRAVRLALLWYEDPEINDLSPILEPDLEEQAEFSFSGSSRDTSRGLGFLGEMGDSDKRKA